MCACMCAYRVIETGRLSISDRVDPYVSTYQPPLGSSSGKAMHVAWDGLVSQQMVVNILTAVKSVVYSDFIRWY